MDIVIASKNLHKIRELRAILRQHTSFDYRSLIDFPHYVPPEEHGETFEENAFLKASHAAEKLSAWVIADDSGLMVAALDNIPGVRSARYAGERATDKENRLKLIKALEGIKEEERLGCYVCALALASPEGVKAQVKGLCEGQLLTAPRGSQGFGYDPLFLKYDYNKTFSEMDEETKNRISHRRKAVEKLLPHLLILQNACTI